MSSCGCDPVPSCTSLPCAGLKQTVGVGSHPTGQRRRDLTLPTHTAQTLLVSLPFSYTGLPTLATTLALERTGAGVGEEEPAETITFDRSLSRSSSMSELGASCVWTESRSGASSQPAESDDSAEAEMRLARQRVIKQWHSSTRPESGHHPPPRTGMGAVGQAATSEARVTRVAVYLTVAPGRR